MAYSSPNSETPAENPSETTLENPSTIYCINPQCSHRENSGDAKTCQNCGTKLLVNNRYKLLKPLRKLSDNSYTDVFLVRDEGLRSQDYGKQKVLKVLKFNDNEELVRLFKQEVKTLLWVDHPGIPKVDEGLFNVNISNPAQSLSCFVMEFIEGDNLEDFINKEEKVNQETALAWFIQIIEILDKLHQQKLPHRDIKPSNLILRPNGQITLIDFGAVGNGEWGETRVGSLGYAAPEQLAGNAVLASDFFGLGKTFVYLLTGRSPTEFPTHKINKKLLWRKHTLGISSLFANLIDDLMADDVRKRPRNIADIQHRLKLIDLPKLVRKEFLERINVIMLIILGSVVFVNNSSLIARGLNLVSLGNIDRSLQNVGTDKFIENQFSSAEFFYKAALVFNPDNLASEYSLGRVCELAKNVDCAEEQYREVIKKNNAQKIGLENPNLEAAAAAASSLTRLQILYQQPFDEKLIRQGLEDTQNPTIKATLWKNLGWWQFQQNQLVEAEKSLRTALELDDNSTATYCLMAQVIEAKQGSIDPALITPWAECAKRVSDRPPKRVSPEELQWGLMAQQRLNANKLIK